MYMFVCRERNNATQKVLCLQRENLPVTTICDQKKLCLPAMMLTFMQEQPKLMVYEAQQNDQLQISKSMMLRRLKALTEQRLSSVHRPKQFYVFVNENSSREPSDWCVGQFRVQAFWGR